MRPTLICTLGVPCAGKSTWLDAQDINYHRVTTVQKTIAETRSTFKLEAYRRALDLALVDAQRDGVAGVDGGFLDVTTRRLAHELAFEAGVSTRLAVFPVPVAEILRRAGVRWMNRESHEGFKTHYLTVEHRLRDTDRFLLALSRIHDEGWDMIEFVKPLSPAVHACACE